MVSQEILKWKRQYDDQNKLIPTIGNVCMDMTFLDVTNLILTKEIELKSLINRKIEDLAKEAYTIPYEITVVFLNV